MSQRHFSAEFKLESASLVVDQGYTVQEACHAVGVGPTAMRRWVNQLKQERQGVTPAGSKALTPNNKKFRN